MDTIISDRALAAFPELDHIFDDEHATTTLVGSMPGRAAMRSILARLDDLGFTLLEMHRIPR
ncbi:hypothetical protein [Rhodococcus jostii]|uniref:hypothetical protein n=1 Tax=Rhodococcus jostii TaxID=132919 RepID=UPI003654893B